MHGDFPVSAEDRHSKWQQFPLLYVPFYRQGCCDSKSLGTVWERDSKNDLTVSLSQHRPLNQLAATAEKAESGGGKK